MRRSFLLSALLLVLLHIAAFAVVGGGDVTMKVTGAGNVVFSHDIHVDKASLGCRDCHSKLYLDTKQHKKVSMKEMALGRSCGSCHNGKVAFTVKGNCAKCHK